jgi:hypothetical protein
MMQRGCGLMMVMVVVMREEEQQAHHAMAGLTRAHCFKTLAYASTLKQLIALPGVVARCLLLSLTPPHTNTHTNTSNHETASTRQWQLHATRTKGTKY